MTDKPDGKRWGLGLAIGLFVAYFGAYYATYTLPRGIYFGTPPHFHYAVGTWELPNQIAQPFFAPAHWADMQTIRRGQPE
jgi:hypothetical protein